MKIKRKFNRFVSNNRDKVKQYAVYLLYLAAFLGATIHFQEINIAYFGVGTFLFGITFLK